MTDGQVDLRGLLLAAVLPVVAFVLLAVLTQPARGSLSRLRRTFGSAEASDAVVVRAPDCPLFAPSEASGLGPPYDHRCTPSGWRWYTSVVLARASGAAPLQAFVLDMPPDAIHPGLFDRRVGVLDPDTPGCTSSANRVLTCDLEVAPHRRYAIVPYDTDAAGTVRLTGPPLLLAAVHPGALSVRGWAVAATGGLIVLGGVLGGLGAVGVRRAGPAWTRLPRRLRVALIGGFGGVVSGLLYALRPADIGGFDLAPSVPAVAQVMLALGVVCAILAVVVDLARSALAVGGVIHQGVGAITLIGGLAVVVVAIYATTAQTPQQHLWLRVSYKTLFYVYLTLAMVVPVLVYRQPGWLQRLSHGSADRTADAGIHVTLGLIGGLFAAAFALVAAPFFSGESPLSALGPFYKPASAPGLWLVLIPAQVGVALGVNARESRSGWYRDLEVHLGQWANDPDPLVRAEAAARAAEVALERRTRLLRGGPELGYVAMRWRELAEALEEDDECVIATLAERRGEAVDTVRRALAAIGADLADVRVPERSVEVPLLLLDGATGEGRRGTLALRCAPEPVTTLHREVAVRVDGERLDQVAGVGLVEGVHRVLAVVLDDLLLGAGVRQRLQWTADFRIGGPGGLEGSSYQLPLALAAWELALGKSANLAWSATGAVRRSGGTVEAVDGLEAKLALVEQGVVVVPARQAEAVEGALVLTAADTSDRVRRVRRDVGRRVRAGERVVVGVSSVGQAVRLVYGEVWG